jgi:negative regulator of flagellin synthesis FlgM
MKINDTIKNSTRLGVDSKPVAGKANTAKLESASANKVEKSQADATLANNVTLSPLSAQLKALEAKVAVSSVFDTEKVDAIKSAISGGKFKVDSEKVADGLIATVKDLLSSQKNS